MEASTSTSVGAKEVGDDKFHYGKAEAGDEYGRQRPFYAAGPGHGKNSGEGHQTNQRRHHWVVPQPHQDAGRYRHRSAEAADAFQKCAEPKPDKQRLRPPVGGQGAAMAPCILSIQPVALRTLYTTSARDIHDGEYADDRPLQRRQQRNLNRKVKIKDSN
jgi:hypothetical protein